VLRESPKPHTPADQSSVMPTLLSKPSAYSHEIYSVMPTVSYALHL
jgi:hypothetical protein